MKIDCCVVRDLLPLYAEKLVSVKTAELVEEHLTECSACKKELELIAADGFAELKNNGADNALSAEPLKKFARKLSLRMQSMYYALIILFVFLGLNITAGSDMMYNSLIMPVVGVFGYFAFRLRSLYKLPVLLLFIEGFATVFGLLNEEWQAILMWTPIYLIFIYLGVAVAFLFHYAFRKE
ncbi:MAG: zf-HC2 domain-containing protein [Ruminococcaceae bacterium]|nr:zf-HC2 domain-containing protein [Oscillospiraceae bacterium]